MMGPLEYVAIGFEGDALKGDVFRALDDVRARGIIRVIDMLFISKDDQGAVTIREVSDLSPAELEHVGGGSEPEEGPDRYGWFAQDDADAVAAQLPLETSAVLILLEHTWARQLRGAAIDAGGFVMAMGRVASDVVDEVQLMLTSAEGGAPA